MSKTVKDMVTNEYRSRYDGLSSACVIDMTGMTVKEQQELRGRVRGSSGRVQVVKTSLARRAFDDGPLSPLGASLDGPCALVTSEETSVVDLAKILAEAAKEFKALTLKSAIIDGDPDILGVLELSKMKGREELIGEIGMLVSSPGRALASCAGSAGSKIAGCLKAIIEKAA